MRGFVEKGFKRDWREEKESVRSKNLP